MALTGCTQVMMSRRLAGELENVVLHSQDSESCGLLLGTANPSHVTVTAVRPVPNMYGLCNRFGIGDDEYRAALRACEPGEQIVGVFHVHFGSPELSVVDLHQLAVHRLIWLVIDGSFGGADWPSTCKCVADNDSEVIDMDLVIDK